MLVRSIYVFLLMSLLSTAGAQPSGSGKILDPNFDDRPLEEPLEVPEWFMLSFLDIKEDLNDIKQRGKKGLILYFGQERCPYCKAFIDNNFSRKDIVTYTQKHFEMVHIDVQGNRMVTDLDGSSINEKAFSVSKRAHFTPSLIFYDAEDGAVLKLVGYQSPYNFRAALEYVADGHYKLERFRDYLARAEFSQEPAAGNLINEPFFIKPPYQLNRRLSAADKPLLVIFEQADCHACEVLHAGPLHRQQTRELMKSFEVVQLDLWGKTPLVTPQGKATTARQWADDLGLYYTPTLLFFDERGREILRVDAIVHFVRLRGILHYVASKAYRTYGSFQLWRDSQRR